MTEAGGLSSADAAARLREYGPNRVVEAARTPWVLRLVREFTQFFSLILWIAAGLAFLAEWSSPGQGMARLGYAIVAVIVVSGVFSFWQEYRAERTLAALYRLLPRQTSVLRDGAAVRLPVEQLVPGDVLVLEQGDNVPADCRLVEAFGVRVNNATVTGEALPQAREAGPATEVDIFRSKNILLAGTSLTAGRARAVVIATGMRTEFGKIAHLTQTGGETVSPLRREIAHLSRVIVLLAVLVGLVFFAAGWVLGVPFWQDFLFAIGIIVAMVPEGLLPTLTLALVLATQRMARRNVLVRHLPAVEALGSTTVICTDKTGTLTRNRMAVQRLFLGTSVESSFDAGEAPRLVQTYRPFFLAAGLCHDLNAAAEGGQTRYLGDPMEVALVDMARAGLREIPVWRRVDEIPFDADRMRLSTVYATPEGNVLYCKGAPETVLPLCRSILADGEARPLTPELRTGVLAAQEAMAERGLRVLALAHRALGAEWDSDSLEQELVFSGLVGLEDPPRAEVPEAIGKCHAAGIKVTGDHPRTAVAIAREIGLVRSAHAAIVTGESLKKLSDTELQLALDTEEIIFARVGADQKRRIVDALKRKQQIVAVTGDGVNDAPALKSAHIGIAMGIAGTDVAREAADIVLLDDNFASIVNAIEEGRAVFDNIRKFLAYLLTHNVPELVPYLGFVLFGIPLALTPIQILAVDMGTDSLTALGLGVEKPDPHVMQRPPRPQRERLLSPRVALRAYLFLGAIEAAAAMTVFFFVLHAGGWSYGQPLASDDPLYWRATAATLCAIVAMQIVNVFLCRDAVRSVWSTGLRGNRLIVAGVLLEIALIALIVYTPWGNAVMGTAPVPPEVWLLLVAFAVGLLLLEESRKWLVRQRQGAGEARDRASVRR